MGIEPTSSAWKAEVLPLNYARTIRRCPSGCRFNILTVEGGGFEPPKAEPADLQSAPFGRSGTPPEQIQCKRLILPDKNIFVNYFEKISTSATGKSQKLKWQIKCA